jgi:methyl-accepting chemotaxis protein
MRFQSIARLAMLGMVLLFGATGGLTYFTNLRLGEAIRAMERQAVFKQLGDDLGNASDYLTNEARRYVQFGGKEHFDNYWREVNETKTRDRVVGRLKELDAPAAELGLIEQAKRNSDALIATEDAAMKAVAAKDFDKARHLMFDATYDRDKKLIMDPIGKFRDTMNDRAAREAAELRASADGFLLATNIFLAITAVVSIGMLYLVVLRGMVRPLGAMSQVMARLAEGEREIALPQLTTKGEVGDMMKAIRVFRDNAQEVERLASEQAEVKQKAEEGRRAAMSGFANEFERNIGGIVETVATAAHEMQKTAQSMLHEVEHSTARASAVAAAAEQATTNVQTVALAAEELSNAIDAIGRRVSQSSKTAAQAVEEASRTDVAVESLAEAANRISEVVNLINEIASQTNLLALNATIEAARAGEAGRGFAVVASQVKGLATQAAKATDEIKTQISSIQTTTGQAVAAIRSISGTISGMHDIAVEITASVEQQGAATQDIASNVSQAARGTTEVSRNIVGITDASRTVGSAASQVFEAAERLSRQSELLRDELRNFTATVRAA